MEQDPAPAGKPRRRSSARRWKLRLMALGLGVVLAFSAGEVFVRITFGSVEPRRHYDPGVYRDDPELGWAMLPKYEGVWHEKLYSVPVLTDSRGLRMKPGEFEAYRSAKERVLVLGDSITFGQGVRAEEAYPAQLGELLRARGRECGVANAGVMGYDTRQERVVLERLIDEAAPDVVLLGWYPNDVTVASRDVREYVKVIDGHLVADEASYRDWRRKIDRTYPWERSALIRWIDIKIRNWSWRNKTLLRRAQQTREGEVVEENMRVCLEELQKIRDLCASKGARLVVLHFVPLELLSDADMPALLWDRVEAFCSERSIPAVDLRDAFTKSYFAAPEKSLYVFADRCHPSPLGHQIAAEAVLDRVVEALDAKN